MRIAVVDYGSGNLASASRALALAAERLGLAAEVAVTADPDAVAGADRIVLPGQGAFADCAHGLDAVPGMRDAIDAATDAGTPFLGICVGMQLMAERGLEHEVTPGFGWIDGEIAAARHARPAPAADGLERPALHARRASAARWAACRAITPISCTATRCAAATRRECLATTDYGGPVVAMVAAGNRAGTQFHVEKSQEVGIRILMNFLRWTP